LIILNCLCLDCASRDQHNIEGLKLARRDYEEKIRRLEIENNELSTLRAQYAVCLKDGEYYKKELAKHTNELKDLRKMKVQLTRELRQEFIRHRQAEQAKAREISTLKRVYFQIE
jgi:septal ring factor EnvC (AmiA/AmiB activator)